MPEPKQVKQLSTAEYRKGNCQFCWLHQHYWRVC